MGAAPSSPVPPPPVYDATTCKAFVGTGCPVPPPPVYDATTCKAFVGTGCPKQSAPVYDATTCASVIKTALDAKKCAPIFGIQYNDSNENVKKIMTAFQNVINQLQKMICSSQLKYLAFDLVNQINDSAPKLGNSGQLRASVQKTLDDMVLPNDAKKYTGITDEQYNQLKSLLGVLSNVIITVNTESDGAVSGSKIKQMTYDIINSLCLNYKTPDRTIDNLFKLQIMNQPSSSSGYTKPVEPTTTLLKVEKTVESSPGKEWGFTNMSDFSYPYLVTYTLNVAPSNEVNKYTDNSYIKVTISNKKYNSTNNITGSAFAKFIKSGTISLTNDKNMAPLTGPTTIDMKVVTGKGEPAIKILAPTNAIITPVSSTTGIVNTVKSTFGAMEDYSISTFGSMGGKFLIFLIILLIVGGILYLLHSKGKVKIPGLPQRIAAFGRQIKAIRKM